jgi:hypothetical protein
MDDKAHTFGFEFGPVAMISVANGGIGIVTSQSLPARGPRSAQSSFHFSGGDD